MSQKELLGLPINSWADEQAHCYLWTTNTNIKDAFELMEACAKTGTRELIVPAIPSVEDVRWIGAECLNHLLD
jgi:hypothetical protein